MGFWIKMNQLLTAEWGRYSMQILLSLQVWFLIPDGSQKFYLLMHFSGIQKLLSPQAADVLLFPICKY